MVPVIDHQELMKLLIEVEVKLISKDIEKVKVKILVELEIKSKVIENIVDLQKKMIISPKKLMIFGEMFGKAGGW